MLIECMGEEPLVFTYVVLALISNAQFCKRINLVHSDYKNQADISVKNWKYNEAQNRNCCNALCT